MSATKITDLDPSHTDPSAGCLKYAGTPGQMPRKEIHLDNT